MKSQKLKTQKRDTTENKPVITADMWNISSTNITSSSYFFDSRSSIFIYLSCTIFKSLLILPLSILVLYIGFQQQHQQQQRSFKTWTHFDIFTFHMSVIELTSVVGNIVFCWGLTTGSICQIKWGLCITSIIYPGEFFIHCLTCVDRYLAVVHPITYMRLRQRGGVQIRNVSISCVWMLSFGFIGVTAYNFPQYPTIQIYCVLGVSFIIVSFCSLSVLFALIRPGPGGGARADQSKQKAFHIIMAILSVLLLWLLAVLVTVGILTTPLLGQVEKHLAFDALPWFNIPSSLVLPVLFLQRAKELLCCQG